MRQIGVLVLLIAGLISTQTIPRLMQVTKNPPSVIGGGGPEAVLNWIVMILLLMMITVVPAAIGIRLIQGGSGEVV